MLFLPPRLLTGRQVGEPSPLSHIAERRRRAIDMTAQARTGQPNSSAAQRQYRLLLREVASLRSTGRGVPKWHPHGILGIPGIPGIVDILCNLPAGRVGPIGLGTQNKDLWQLAVM